MFEVKICGWKRETTDQLEIGWYHNGELDASLIELLKVFRRKIEKEISRKKTPLVGQEISFGW